VKRATVLRKSLESNVVASSIFPAASLAPLDGSDFHAYRRAWATARKHLPLKDVAEAGGWRSTDTLLRCYTQVDDATMLAVLSETRKMRAAGAKP
jgi:hypothetical protein